MKSLLRLAAWAFVAVLATIAEGVARLMEYFTNSLVPKVIETGEAQSSTDVEPPEGPAAPPADLPPDTPPWEAGREPGGPVDAPDAPEPDSEAPDVPETPEEPLEGTEPPPEHE